MQVRKQQLELDMEQQTGSKQEKEYVKAVYCHPVYLTYMQSTSREMLGWKKHKLESRLLGEISITSSRLVASIKKKKSIALFQYFQKSLRLILIGPAESHAQEYRPF